MMRLFLIACVMMLCAGSVQAQTPDAAEAQPLAEEAAVAPPAVVDIPDYDPRAYLPLGVEVIDGKLVVSPQVAERSLLFTPDDLGRVLNALNRKAQTTSGPRGTVTVIGADGIETVTGEGEEGEVKPYYPPIPTKRVISLSGVLYRKPGDWIVWLNGHKLVPGKKLPEIVDIKVERDRVHLKWFDIGMAKIIAITLRPHQTYDIVSGVMLSGSAAGGQ